jgi:hypothetical protein
VDHPGGFVRILVCGPRSYTLDHVLPALLASYADVTDVTIICGGARGADRHAADWAYIRGLPVEEYPADWDRHGKAAGPIRNQRMLDEGKPDAVFAFVDKPLAESRGTADMVRRARQAGLPVYVVEAS